MNVLPYNEQVTLLTDAMRECDRQFETTGGGTRHYVRDLLLPWLTQRDICLVKVSKEDYASSTIQNPQP